MYTIFSSAGRSVLAHINVETHTSQYFSKEWKENWICIWFMDFCYCARSPRQQSKSNICFVVWFCFNELHLNNASNRLSCKSVVVTRLHCIIVTTRSISVLIFYIFVHSFALLTVFEFQLQCNCKKSHRQTLHNLFSVIG